MNALEAGKEIKYIAGFDSLERLCKAAIKANYNRQIDWKALKNRFTELNLAENTRFPITFHMIHNDSEIRIIFVFMNLEEASKEPVSIPVEHRPEQVQLDVSFKDFLALPTMSVAI